MTSELTRREFLVKSGYGGALLFGGALLAACSDDAEGTATTTTVVGSTARATTTVVWTANNIPENLDPAIGFDSNSLMFIRSSYDTLYTYAPGSTDSMAVLASGYEVSDDGLIYTFSLRDDVVFSDGTNLTAEDVKVSFDRIAGINQGPASYMGRLPQYEAIDGSTFQIRLAEPYSYLLGILAWLPVVSSAAIEANKTADDPWAQEFFASNAAGSGPYQLEAMSQNEVTLTLRDDYWGEAGSRAPDTLVLGKVVDPSTRLQLLDNNEAQVSGGGWGPTDFAAAASLSNVELVEQEGLTLRTVAMNTQRTPTDDPVFREALVNLFDYSAYFDYYQSFGDPTTGPLPPGFPGARGDEFAYARDMDRAAELLEQGNYVDTGLELSFVSVQGADFGAFAGTLLQSALAEFGITLETQSLPWPQIPPIMEDTQSAFHLSFLNISANIPDPTDVLLKQYARSAWGTDGGYNWAYYDNPELEDLVAEALAATDPAASEAAVARAVDVVVNDYPTIYAIAPKLVQPVNKDWISVKYDALFNIQVTRPIHYT